MEFSQINETMNHVVFENVRVHADMYFEAVLTKDALPGLARNLEQLFGPPIWPGQGKPLSEAIKKVIDDFGGITKGQTLYFYLQSPASFFAMLWPWQDGQHITVKIGQV